MPKNDEPIRPDVVWNLSNDALEPKAAPWGFVAQNPVLRVIPPGAKVRIDTGIAASCPMLAFPRGEQAEYVTIQQLIPAGQNVTLIVENKSQHSPLIIDDKEAVVNLHPLLFKGLAVVG